MFLQFCIDGGVTEKGKKQTALLYESVKVHHELWVELEVTPMLAVSPGKEQEDLDACILSPCNWLEIKSERAIDTSDDDKNAFRTMSKIVQLNSPNFLSVNTIVFVKSILEIMFEKFI